MQKVVLFSRPSDREEKKCSTVGTATFDGDLKAIHVSRPGIGNRENGWRTCDVDSWLATANPQAAQGQQHLCHSPVPLTAKRFWSLKTWCREALVDALIGGSSCQWSGPQKKGCEAKPLWSTPLIVNHLWKGSWSTMLKQRSLASKMYLSTTVAELVTLFARIWMPTSAPTSKRKLDCYQQLRASNKLPIESSQGEFAVSSHPSFHPFSVVSSTLICQASLPHNARSKNP